MQIKHTNCNCSHFLFSHSSTNIEISKFCLSLASPLLVEGSSVCHFRLWQSCYLNIFMMWNDGELMEQQDPLKQWDYFHGLLTDQHMTNVSKILTTFCQCWMGLGCQGPITMPIWHIKAYLFTAKSHKSKYPPVQVVGQNRPSDWDCRQINDSSRGKW